MLLNLCAAAVARVFGGTTDGIVGHAIDSYPPATKARRPWVAVDSCAQRYVVEALEPRTLLTGTIPIGMSFSLSPQPFGEFGGSIPSGFTTTVTVSVYNNAAPGNPDSLLFPTGTLNVFWYGGATIASLPVIPGVDPGNPNILRVSMVTPTVLTLNLADAGPALAAGPLEGRHILAWSYSGDGNFSGQVIDGTSTAFAAAEAGTYSPRWPIAITGAVAQENLKLAFLHSPDDAAVDDDLSPAITVQVLDRRGVPVLDTPVNVTLQLSGGDGAILSGATTVQSVNGIATFNDLSIDKVGRYQLIASGISGQQPIFSRVFEVTGRKLTFLSSPRSGTAGSILQPPIRVAVQVGRGTTLTTDNSTVITLDPVGFAGNSPISGNTATVVNGIATFDHLILKRPGTYQLQASDGESAVATTKKFKVSGGTMKIVAPPLSVDVNAPTELKVALLDANKRIVTASTTYAQLTLTRIDPASTGTLGGTVIVPFIGGYATFGGDGGPFVDQPGFYTFTVTELSGTPGSFVDSETSAPIATGKFQVGGYKLIFSKRPIKQVDVNKPLSFEVAQVDAKKHVNMKLNSHHVQLTLTRVGAGETAVLSDFTNLGFTAGRQLFASDTAPSIDIPGMFTLTATEVDANNVVVATTEAVTSGPFKVAGYHIQFTSQPRDSSYNRAIPMSFRIVNARGQVDATQNTAKIKITETTLSGSGGLSYTHKTFVNGEVELPAKTKDILGNGTGAAVILGIGTFTLTVSATDVQNNPIRTIEGVTSRAFKITPFHLAFLTQPKIATVSGALPFKLAVLDARGTIDDEDDESRVILSSTEGSLSYTHTTFVDGVIDFPAKTTDALGLGTGAVQILKAGKFTLTASAGGANLVPIDLILPATSKTFSVVPPKMKFIIQPVTIGLGLPVPFFRVGYFDHTGAELGYGDSEIEISYRRASTRNAVPVVLGSQVMTDGVATFQLYRIEEPGIFVIVATDLSTIDPATPVVSALFSIVP